MNIQSELFKSKISNTKQRIIGLTLAVLLSVPALPVATTQARTTLSIPSQQAASLYIDNAAIVEISQLYTSQNRTYQAQWTQLFRDIAPNWRFARALNHTTCLPAPAYDANFVQNPGAGLKFWPVPGQSGCTKEEATNEMVTYVDPHLCNPDTLRVGYWLYFKKDGFTSAGHRHDWEGVVIELKRLGGGASPAWTYNQVIGSFHREYHTINWNDNTLEKTPDGKHPVIFIGWAHHAVHYTKGGRSDVASTWTVDLRNSYIQLNSWKNLVIIPTEHALAQNILKNGNFGDANPPLTKDVCALS